MSYQKVFILGNVGRDPEVRHLQGGGGYVTATFSVATSEGYKDKDGNRQTRTEWHNIVVWGKQAEFAEKYVRSGASVFIEGKIRTLEYTDKNGSKRSVTEIVADTIQFAGAPKQESKPQQQPQPNDDIPF